MESWSDGFLGTFQTWVAVIAIIGTALGLLSGIAALLAHQETSRRQSIKEVERASRLKATEEELVASKAQIVDTERETRAARELANRLELALRPRTVTPEQQTELVNAISKLARSSIEFESPSDDAEAAAFASQLLAVFEASGLAIVGFSRAQYPNHLGPTGLTFNIPSPQQKPLGMSVVAALADVGFPTKVTFGRLDQPRQFALVVGPRELHGK